MTVAFLEMVILYSIVAEKVTLTFHRILRGNVKLKCRGKPLWLPLDNRRRGNYKKRWFYPFLGRPIGRNCKTLPASFSNFLINLSEPQGIFF